MRFSPTSTEYLSVWKMQAEKEQSCMMRDVIGG